ncbi:TPA: hypothetical protein R4K21_003064 [Stenotrophomonas maltophilia]|nr:hypothetical protein [Stenotrophomonas maltophilia]
MEAKRAFYVAKVTRYGTNSELRHLLNLYLQHCPEEAGEHAVIDNSLLHLCGWSVVESVADSVAASMREGSTAPDDGDVVLVRMWPHDVSAWPSVYILDGAGEMHIHPKLSCDLERNFVADGDRNG